MKLYLLVFSLVIISTSSFAQTGISESSFVDESRGRTIKTRILYPTDSKLTSKHAENIAFYGFDASEDSLISKKSLPLYIFIHGTSGNWKNLSWLANELAKDAVVVSSNYPDYTTGQASPESILKPWNLPKDVSFLITQILNSSYGEYINPEKVAVIGHSLGGYTAMALVGARIDLNKYVAFCSTENDKSCSYFNTALARLSKENIIKAKQSLADARVKASIALAPGFVESMTKESLKSLIAPTLIISAEKDENVPPRTHLENIPKSIQQYQLSDASHFSFLQRCKPEAIAILAEEQAEFVCKDGNNRDRESIHQEVIHLVKSFLLKNGV